MLGDLDGFEVARRIRETDGSADRLPVIFLTARDATSDKITGLGLGGDDYVTKPFSVEELVARVQAVLRRSSSGGYDSRRLAFADLVLDEDTREVWRGDRSIELTVTEYRLLHYLLLNARRVLSGPRSSSRSGSTTSPATPACSRPTSATCATRSTTARPR